jgi:precorrin-2 dehydrogenase/sirohydrochlorin ferrochelatase
MRYFPIFLDLRGKLCVIAGGGRVAERKARKLLEAGARVRVVSPELTAGLHQLKWEGKILHRERRFQARDLGNAHLAIAATDDRELNRRICQLCGKRRIWVNGVDDPLHSSFIFPSVVKKGDLVLAISTSGKSPAMARALRRKLEKEIGSEYSLGLKILGKLRNGIKGLNLPPGQKKKIFQRLVQEDLGRFIRGSDPNRLESHFRNILQREFGLPPLRLSRGRDFFDSPG